MSTLGTYALYYFVILSSSLIAYFSGFFKKINAKRLAKLIFFSSMIIPIIVSGLRNGVGVDYYNYINVYNRVTQNYTGIIHAISESRYEPGWIALNFIVEYLFDDVKYIFITSALLTWLFAFKAIYDNRERISDGIAVLILLCTLYNVSFNIIRQVLAVSVIMLSIKPLIDKRFWKFALTVLFASTFHLTALIFLPSYWIINSRSKYSRLFKNIVVPLSFIGLVLFIKPILTFISGFDIFSTYGNYDLEFSVLYKRDIILRIPVVILILINLRKLKLSNNPIYKLSMLFIIGIILSVLGSYAPYINRVSMYFDVTQVFIISAIVKAQTNKIEKFLYTYLIVIYYISWFTFLFIYLGLHGTIPYQWN